MNNLGFSIGDILKTTLNKMLILSTDDFIHPEKCQFWPGLTDIQLECEGYSLFKPEQTLENFIKYIQELANQVQANKKIQVKTMKIFLNGFKLNSKDNFLQKLAKYCKMMDLNMKTLWIHTSDLNGVRLSDFRCLYNLISEIGGKQNLNFQDFSLQCANWTFENSQPQFQQLKGVFKQSFEDLSEMNNRLHQKHVRLQISGWYYNIFDAQYFLDFRMTDDQLKNIKQKQKPKYAKYNEAKNPFSVQLFDKSLEIFHLQMQNLISKLVQIMEDIQELQIDMRNNHELLKTKKLKERIVSTVTKTNRVNKSMISMRNKQKIQEAADKDKPFRLSIMM